MAERRTGLGKGLGALIPPARRAADGAGQTRKANDGNGAPAAKSTRRPVDLLFTSSTTGHTATEALATSNAELSGSELVDVPGAEFTMVPIGSIGPNPRQPRQVFDEDALRELADSIKEVGLLQPVVLRPVSPGKGAAAKPTDGDEGAAGHEAEQASAYELVMGERRWRASQLAGLEEVPAIVRATEDSELLRNALLENLHRAQLNPLEEAAAYRQLLDDFACTQEELAVRVARSRPQISNTLRLLKLPPLVQRRVAAGVLSAGHARALLGLDDAAQMERLAQKIVAEGLSVRGTEELVTLGEVPPPAQAKKAAVRAGGQRQALDDLQERLTDRFDTKVSVSLGKSKGRVTIEFASLADLNRIIEILDPSDPGVLK